MPKLWTLLAFLQPGWHFPLTFHGWGRSVPIHLVTDILAYCLGFRLYVFLRKRASGPMLCPEESAWIFVGCIFGALVGSKLLAWMEAPGVFWALRHDPNFWYGGKTIVGGLIGGWMGVELAKKILGVTQSTGDLCIYPVILGMCIGRMGCFLTGLSDDTYGIQTQLPWGVDFGDGIPRHPTQLYEILFLLGLGTVLWLKRSAWSIPGQKFRWFMLGYLSFRLGIDFYKPHSTLLMGLSGIQWACLLGLIFCALSILKLSQQPLTESPHV